ncbi:MAG: hypothetical protein IKR73_09230, partial [Oscillospiraceae bacterium]|nr:hypothetical protein [Oscillospiraceae bacterium]
MIMKKVIILLTAAVICTAVTGCSANSKEKAETLSNQEINEQAYASNVDRANKNAEELLGYVEEYAVMCVTRSGKLASGRYAGRVYESNVELEDIEYSGKQEDMAKYLSHCASSSAWSWYFAVMIDDGMPSICYVSDADISTMDFSKYTEPDQKTMTSQ